MTLAIENTTDVLAVDFEAGGGEAGGELDPDKTDQVVFLVLLEMGLSCAGIVSNLLVVTTIRHHDHLQNTTTNLLLANLCFSNLLISFLVKPISAIYAGYAVSTGQWQVSLVFCSLYTILYRTTWCVLPFTLVALCWIKARPNLSCLKNYLYSRSQQSMTGPASSGSGQSVSMSPSLLTVPAPTTPLPSANNFSPSPAGDSRYLSPVPPPLSPESKRRLAELSEGLTVRQKVVLGAIWVTSALFGIATCFPEKVFGVEMLVNVDTGLKKKVVTVGGFREEELTVCTVKTGVNDFLDYISVAVTLVLPSLFGPLASLPAHIYRCVRQGCR